MIAVDSRAGSCELAEPLRAAGLPVESTRLEFGDLFWVGRGEQGAPLAVGVEHKKLPDLVNSLNTDRLAGHQLTGMLRTYDRSYLVIEGQWEADADGRVVVPSRVRGRWQPLKGAMLASALEQRVLTLAHRGGLQVRWTRDQAETVRFLSALYRFWVDRDLNKHSSHLAIHSPDLDRALLTPVSDARRVYAAFPYIGYTRSGAVERHFSTVWDAVNASEKDWMHVDGIGKQLATKVVGFVRGRKEG